MILKQLSITRKERWQDPAMPLQGTVEFSSPNGSMTLPLNEATSQKVVELIAKQIVASAHDAANMIAADVIAQVPALAAPSDGN